MQVLHIVTRNRVMSRDAIAKEMGLPAADVHAHLNRLSGLNYVSRKGSRYRPEARHNGY